MPPNPDRGPMAVFVYAIAIVVVVACVAIRLLLNVAGNAPAGQMFRGMVR